MLQEARLRQASPKFREDIKLRQTVEHTIARVIQLGARQARYFGKAKTKYQMTMVAIVANLGVIQRALSGLVLWPSIAFVASRLPKFSRACLEGRSKATGQTVKIVRPQFGLLGTAA